MSTVARDTTQVNPDRSTYVHARALTADGYRALLTQNARQVAYERAGLPVGTWRIASRLDHRYGDPHGAPTVFLYAIDAISGELLVEAAFLNADAVRCHMARTLPGYTEAQ